MFVCRTRLTSFVPSCDHKSTLRTNMLKSISLRDIRKQSWYEVCRDKSLLWVYLHAGHGICDNQSYARWGSNRTTILQNTSVQRPRNSMQNSTLSPNPHILARFGCCTTSSLRKCVSKNPRHALLLSGIAPRVSQRNETAKPTRIENGRGR